MDRSIIIGLILLVAASCHKQGGEEHAVNNISLNPEVAEVKSLVESSTELMADGNELTLYDIHTRQDGSLYQYMEDQKVEYSTGKWRFQNASGNDIDIPWTKQGHHHFLAYLSKYGSNTLTWPVSYIAPSEGGIADDQKITISQTLSPANQFDFMYATHARNVETQGTGTVPLEMKHLFSAVEFRVLNMSGNQMTVVSFEIDGMRVSGSAEIGFVSQPDIVLSDAPSDSGFDVSNKTISGTIGTMDMLHGGAILIWPHKSDYYKNVTCTFSYRLGSSSESEVSLALTAANAAVTSWDAGCRYIYTITISENVLFDVVRVVDWINDDVILK